MSKDVLRDSRAAVDRLLERYRQYLAVQQQVRAEKARLTQAALAMARESGRPFPELLRELPGELAGIERAVKRFEYELQTISDDMTFANPVVWMQYKFEAYAGTSQAIVDLDDFRKHCSKPGYICTKRFEFVNEWLRRSGADLRDESWLPGATQLDVAYSDDRIVALCIDEEFMRLWDSNEYHRMDNGRVAKWENYYSSSV